MPAIASNQTETAATRIVVIEDQRELREGLQILLNYTPNFHCVHSFGSMETALAGLEADNLPDLILTDIGLPRMDGIEGTRILRGKFPAVPIIVLTVHGEDDKIFEALCAGASGYLLKNTAPAQIVEAVKEVLNGGAPMSPEVARRVVHLFRTFAPPVEVEYHLTEQERRILRMLVEGHHYKTAAYELGISRSTIAFHLKNIYEKLQVHSKTEAVAKALREKII
ncbi:MAG: response regulator transcription factor [Acidobacteria bacterium]|nr:response regulator transcription factor [Acidobacteriota bacterium]MCA1637206.1 response regulator transcription factor [Acidobacteriota bacterium]